MLAQGHRTAGGGTAPSVLIHVHAMKIVMAGPDPASHTGSIGSGCTVLAVQGWVAEPGPDHYPKVCVGRCGSRPGLLRHAGSSSRSKIARRIARVLSAIGAAVSHFSPNSPKLLGDAHE